MYTGTPDPLGVASTQKMDVGTQIRNGARFLDLRIQEVNGIWTTFHNIFNGDSLSNILNQIIDFSLANPNEPLILFFQNLPSALDKRKIKELEDFIVNYKYKETNLKQLIISPDQLRRNDGRLNLSLRNITYQNGNILIIWDSKNNEEYEEFFPKSLLNSQWPDKNNPEGLLKSISTYSSNFKYKEDGIWIPQIVLSGKFGSNLNIEKLTMMLDRGAYPYYLYNRVSNQNNGKVGFVAMVDFYNYPNPS